MDLFYTIPYEVHKPTLEDHLFIESCDRTRVESLDVIGIRYIRYKGLAMFRTIPGVRPIYLKLISQLDYSVIGHSFVIPGFRPLLVVEENLNWKYPCRLRLFVDIKTKEIKYLGRVDLTDKR